VLFFGIQTTPRHARLTSVLASGTAFGSFNTLFVVVPIACSITAHYASAEVDSRGQKYGVI
jgi:hypothetical protein